MGKQSIQPMTITYFPQEIPAPEATGPHDIPQKMDIVKFGGGYSDQGPTTTRKEQYFLYTWHDATPETKQALESFMKGITGKPIQGWSHPGQEKTHIVSLGNLLVPFSVKAEGTFIYMKVEARILIEGTFGENYG